MATSRGSWITEKKRSSCSSERYLTVSFLRALRLGAGAACIVASNAVSWSTWAGLSCDISRDMVLPWNELRAPIIAPDPRRAWGLRLYAELVFSANCGGQETELTN